MRVSPRVMSVCLLSLVACKPAPTTPERLELNPSTMSLQFGESQIVEARALIGTKGTSLEGLTWTSSDPLRVAVTPGADGTASVQGLQAGTATVTAQVREATATLEVTVAPRVIVLESIELTPLAPQVAKGLRLQLTATGVYNDGSRKDLTTSAAWATADSTRATVTAGGLVSGVGVGEVEVRALKEGFTGRVTLTVTAATVVGLDVRPAQTSLAMGTSQSFSATARLSDATTQVVTAQATWSFSDPAVASTDAAGRVTAHTVGSGTLTATLGDVSGTATVTVTSAVLQTLTVVPAALSLPLGSTEQLTVTGHFSDASEQDLTSMASWRSGTPLVATVSNTGLVTSVGLGLSVVTATVNSISASSSVTCTAAQLQTIHVAPQGLSLALGLTRSFTATGIYTDTTSRDLTAAMTWSSSDAGVATVSNVSTEVGLVRALSEGTTTISATNGTLTGSSVLTIAPAMLVSIQLTPATVNVPKGLTQQVTARGTFSDASQRDVTAEMTWASDATSIATVSSAGLVSAAALGTASITASSGLVSASMSVVVVAPTLQRIDVTGPASSLAKGRTQQLTATGVYSDGSNQNLTSTVTWAPASGAILTVSSAGLLTAVAVGSAAATATSGTIIGTANFTVTAAELDSISVTPASPSIPRGLTQSLVARGVYSDGTTPVLSTGLTWASEDTNLATVSAAGLVSAVNLGSVLITATVGTLSGSTTVTVGVPALTSITVSPTNPSLEKTQTQQLAAEGHYSDSTTAVVTGLVAWESGTPGIASVDVTGLVTGVLPGTATVSATLSSVTGSTNVSVNRPVLATLDVTPATAAIERGATLAFSALATYVDMSTEVVTSLVTWSSSDGGVASISAAGVTTAHAAGIATITAGWGTVTDTAELTVNPPVLQSIVVSGRALVAVGSAVQLLATGTFSDSSTSDVTEQANWASDAGSMIGFANVDGGRGLALGLAAGNGAVTATVGSVTSATPLALQVIAINAPYAGRCGPGLVISQVYGGGGNTGAAWRNDFIELHNPTIGGLSVNGLSVQYASDTGTTWQKVNLSNITVPAGGYYLVQLSSGGAVGTLLPTADQIGSIDMSGTKGKVALVNGITALSGACPTTGVIDFVGYGTTADCFEGARAPAPANSTWLTRGASGCRDGNQNNIDFTVSTSAGLPTNTPRSLAAASAPLLCSCFVNGTASSEELNSCVLQSPASLSTAAGAVSTPVGASITQAGVTDSAGFNATLQVQAGFGPAAANPTSAAGWWWWPSVGVTPGTTSDGYEGHFVAPVSGSYGFTARATRDGVNWTACDLNGAGSGMGLAFEMGQIGALTVP